MTEKLAKPKNGRGWHYMDKQVATLSTPHMAFRHIGGITVISDIVNTQRGLELHMSITKNGKFPSPRVIRRVREDFDAQDFERDDHSTKIASLWLPLNKDKRGICECK